MKKWILCISVLLLALSCVGQKDDPEPEVDPEPGKTEVEEFPAGEGYFRRCLVLDFTGTWCVNCPKMESAIEEAQEKWPGRLLCLSVHNLDAMELAPQGQELAARFGVAAYPSAVIDLDAASLVSTASSELLMSHCRRLLDGRSRSAGIRLNTVLADGKVNAQVEAQAVREGYYTLHCVLLEDGIVAPQTGGSQEHIHNNVLRGWCDSEAYTLAAPGKLEWSCSFDAAPGMRLLAFVCRGDFVDNVISCSVGEILDYQYEE